MISKQILNIHQKLDSKKLIKTCLSIRETLKKEMGKNESTPKSKTNSKEEKISLFSSVFNKFDPNKIPEIKIETFTDEIKDSIDSSIHRMIGNDFNLNEYVQKFSKIRKDFPSETLGSFGIEIKRIISNFSSENKNGAAKILFGISFLMTSYMNSEYKNKNGGSYLNKLIEKYKTHDPKKSLLESENKRNTNELLKGIYLQGAINLFLLQESALEKISRDPFGKFGLSLLINGFLSVGKNMSKSDLIGSIIREKSDLSKLIMFMEIIIHINNLKKENKKVQDQYNKFITNNPDREVKYLLLDSKRTKILAYCKTKKEAEKREKEIQAFKHM